MFQTIDTAEPNLPVNLFAPEENTAENGNSNWIPITCCGYTSYPLRIDSIPGTDVDE